MIVKYSPRFLQLLKKVNVRIRKSLKERIVIFIQNPNDLELNNHPLRDKYAGYRSIDVTADWRAIFEEIQIGENTIAYFIGLGTHKELYSK